MKRKIFYFFIFIFLLFFLSGCGQKTPTVPMDQPAADGNYHYQNFDLKFSLVLPPEFIYYQTQRKNQASFIDIEFFVPTNYAAFSTEVSGYSKVITLRSWTVKMWQKLADDDASKKDFEKISQTKDRIYAISFWSSIPPDWQNKWSDDMKDRIMKSFEIK